MRDRSLMSVMPPPSPPPAAPMDAQRFAAAVAATQSDLRAYIGGMGVAPADVDDIAQEAYLRWYREPERRPADVEPIRWLKGIARHAALDHFRRQARRGEALRAVAEALDRQPQPPAAPGDAALDALRACLAALPDDEREMLRRHYGDDDSAEAIGGTIGRSVDAIRRTLRRVRHALKDCLERKLGGAR